MLIIVVLSLFIIIFIGFSLSFQHFTSFPPRPALNPDLVSTSFRPHFDLIPRPYFDLSSPTLFPKAYFPSLGSPALPPYFLRIGEAPMKEPVPDCRGPLLPHRVVPPCFPTTLSHPFFSPNSATFSVFLAHRPAHPSVFWKCLGLAGNTEFLAEFRAAESPYES